MNKATLLRRQKSRNKQEGKSEMDPEQVRNVNTDEEANEKTEMAKYTEELRAGLTAIKDEIKELRSEFHSDLATFEGEIKGEISAMRAEIDRKCSENQKELQVQAASMEEAQTRIAELEEWQADSGTLMWEMSERTRRLQEKLTDLEGRSRRNNLRIYGVPEDAEKDSESLNKYVEHLLTTELGLPEGTELHIQRCHRALVKKPGPDATPRSIVTNFLQYDTKEMILQKVWGKEKKTIKIANKQVFFDHDYATEVIQKRKTYGSIKKRLKQEGIRFQTPLAKIRIYWDDGAKIYEDAREAALDMRARGYTMEDPGGEREAPVPRRSNSAPALERDSTQPRGADGAAGATVWQRAGGRRDRLQTARRIKERLQEFKRM